MVKGGLARVATLTMANTLFGAMSRVRPLNWGLIIHEVVGRALPNVGHKPSFLSPFILHLYQHFDCITAEEEDMLTIAADEAPTSSIRRLGTSGRRLQATPLFRK